MLDLLSEPDIRRFFSEAQRVLVPFDVPSEVLILQLNDCPDNGL